MALRSPTPFHNHWGVEQSVLTLPNVVGAPTQSSVLELGDLATVSTGANVALYQCIDPTLGAAVWQVVGPGGLTRSYGDGSVVFRDSAFPTNVAVVAQTVMGSGGNVDLVNYFDSIYFRCQVYLRVLSNFGVVISEQTLTFANLAALVTWLNANVPNDGVSFTGDCMFRVFDRIDGAIEMPSKVYGKNRFFAGLTSKAPGKHYWSPRTKSCAYASLQVAAIQTLFQDTLLDMWNKIHGVGTIQATPWGFNEFGSFWISNNKRRRFDMPGFSASALSVQAANGDRSVQLGGVTVAPGSPSWDFAGGIYYGSLRPGATSFTTFGQTAAFTELAQQILDGSSVVVGYGLRNVAGELAVMIKPVGIDQLYFDYFDPTQYQLEAVGRTRQFLHPRIRVLTPGVILASQRVAGPVDATQFAQTFGATTTDENSGIVGRHSYTTGDVRFQLRRLSDGAVSPLTTVRVAPVIRKRARPWAMMVVDGVSV